MAHLIEDLLDVSRIVGGKMRLEVAPVQMPSVLYRAIDAVQPAASAKGIRIDEHVDADLPPVPGDATRLQQVIWNLLSNAVKFTPAGGTVWVSARPRQSQIEVAVRDSGVGIEARFLPHVFEPFRQGEAGVARSTGGLGLGLAIVKRLVELHGGQVEAQSDGPGQGATFTVRLPVPAFPTIAVRQREPVTAGGDAPEGSVEPRLEGLHVLVVEDDIDTRDVVAEALSGCGARVTLAGSVAEAMDAFAR
jgi:signal transduction histidine kinase